MKVRKCFIIFYTQYFMKNHVAVCICLWYISCTRILKQKYLLKEAGYSLFLLANLEIVTKILALPSKLIDIRHPLPSHNGKFFTLSSAILESWAAVSLLRIRTFMLDEMFSWIWHISFNFLLISPINEFIREKVKWHKIKNEEKKTWMFLFQN